MIEVAENEELARFEIRVDGELAGFADYAIAADHWAFDHTRIYPQFEARGLGSELIKRTLDAMRDRGLAVYPGCTFVRHFIDTHRDYLDLVPADVRQRFGLAA